MTELALQNWESSDSRHLTRGIKKIQHLILTDRQLSALPTFTFSDLFDKSFFAYINQSYSAIKMGGRGTGNFNFDTRLQWGCDLKFWGLHTMCWVIYHGSISIERKLGWNWLSSIFCWQTWVLLVAINMDYIHVVTYPHRQP